jgi:hypothetical protein
LQHLTSYRSGTLLRPRGAAGAQAHHARALAVKDTAFIHTDFTSSRRVLAWQRAPADNPALEVRFSDCGTPNPADLASGYRVDGWPATPPGAAWREVTQDRAVPADWVGREPNFPWEARVYVLVTSPRHPPISAVASRRR